MSGDAFFGIGMIGNAGAAEELKAFDATELMAVWGRVWGDKLAEEMRTEAPYREDDGSGSGEHLRDSIAFGGVEAGAGRISMTWTSDVPWAPFVVGGTEPHEIHARFARALHFLGSEGEVFARSVNHPGTEPDPFPLRALEHLLPEMTESFAALFEEM